MLPITRTTARITTADMVDAAYHDPETANAYGPSQGSIPNGADDNQVFKAFRQRADTQSDVHAIERGMGTKVSPSYVVDDN